jgi:hypothetical protein
MSLEKAMLIKTVIEELIKNRFTGKVTFEVNFLTGGVTRVDYEVKQELKKR